MFSQLRYAPLILLACLFCNECKLSRVAIQSFYCDMMSPWDDMQTATQEIPSDQSNRGQFAHALP